MLRHLKDNPELLVIWIFVFLLAITVHEFAHAWMAYRQGDDTAAQQGRLTLNPLDHLDPIGTLMILFAPFGWAKPVPVDPTRFRDPRRGEIYVSFAGPASNMIQAVIYAVLTHIAVYLIHHQIVTLPPEGIRFVLMLGTYGVMLNLALAFFNMLPLFPLDGYHITKGLLPLNAAIRYTNTRHLHLFVLIGVIFFGAGVGLFAPIHFLMRLLLPATI